MSEPTARGNRHCMHMNSIVCASVLQALSLVLLPAGVRGQPVTCTAAALPELCPEECGADFAETWAAFIATAENTTTFTCSDATCSMILPAEECCQCSEAAGWYGPDGVLLPGWSAAGNDDDASTSPVR
eukprot:SAG11_NODE_19373_length_468_cov_0.693767_1_plen_128_part_10